MIDPADALNAPEASSSLFWAAARAGAMLLLLVAGAWAWLKWHRKLQGPRKVLEVVDRAFLARSVSIALVDVGGRRLLLGVSTEGVRLLRDMGEGTGVAAMAEPEEVAGAVPATVGAIERAIRRAAGRRGQR